MASPIERAAVSRLNRERDFTTTELPVYPADDWDVFAALAGRQQSPFIEPPDHSPAADRRHEPRPESPGRREYDRAGS